MIEFELKINSASKIRFQDNPPVEEPPNQPQKPPIKEPGYPTEPPPPPSESPVKEPPNEPGKPPVKEPPPKDSDREPSSPFSTKQGSQIAVIVSWFCGSAQLNDVFDSRSCAKLPLGRH
jgi:hypothetical protein